MSKIYILLLAFFVLVSPCHGEIILRSVNYSVGADVALNEAREKAINEIRVSILSEIGVLVESHTQVEVLNDKSSQYMSYSQIAGGYVSLKIIDEVYDGSDLFLQVQADIQRKNILDVINKIYSIDENLLKIQNLEEELNIKGSKLSSLEVENVNLRVRLNLIKKSVENIERSVFLNNKDRKKIAQIESGIKKAKAMSKERMKTKTEMHDEMIRLSEALFIRGMLYSEFTSVIEATDIQEVYEKRLGRACHYARHSKSKLFMITEDNNDVYGIEVDDFTKKIIRIGLFKTVYDDSNNRCWVGYVGV